MTEQTIDAATGEIELWSDADECALTKCEARIVHGLTESWIALKDVNERRLYRKWGNWEQYCSARWGFSGGRGFQLIQAAQVVLELAGTGVVIPNERVARSIVALEPSKRLSVVLAARSAFGEKLTGGAIASASKVIDEAIQTGGYIDAGSGQTTRLDAAIIGEEAERIDRQRQHIADAASRANGTAHDQRVSMGLCQVVEKASVDGYCYLALRVTAEVLNQFKEGQTVQGVLFIKEVKPDA